jgi:hypothetical protein
MMKLLVVCVTVLLFAVVRECGQTYRLLIENEERSQAWLRANYERQHPAPPFHFFTEPSLEITPAPKKEWQV